MKFAPIFAFTLAMTAAAYAGGAGNPLASLRLENLSATRERPLFSPSRRPPPPPAPPLVEAAPVAEKDVPPAAPPFDLIGAVVGRAEKLVLLRNHATNEVMRLREGDEIGGWRIEAVSLRSAALARGGRVETLFFVGQDTAAPADGSTPELAVSKRAPLGPRLQR